MHVGSMAYANLSRSVCDASGFRRETELHSAFYFTHLTFYGRRLFTHACSYSCAIYLRIMGLRDEKCGAHTTGTLIAALSSSVPDLLRASISWRGNTYTSYTGLIGNFESHAVASRSPRLRIVVWSVPSQPMLTAKPFTLKEPQKVRDELIDDGRAVYFRRCGWTAAMDLDAAACTVRSCDDTSGS